MEPIQRHARGPRVGDQIVVTIIDLDPEIGAHIQAVEYPGLTGLISTSDLTRSKRVKSYRQICPINSIKVVEVQEISQQTGELQCSLKVVDKNYTARVLDRFSQNTKTINVLRKFSYVHSYDTQEVCRHLLWPLIDTDDSPFRCLSH